MVDFHGHGSRSVNSTDAFMNTITSGSSQDFDLGGFPCDMFYLTVQGGANVALISFSVDRDETGTAERLQVGSAANSCTTVAFDIPVNCHIYVYNVGANSAVVSIMAVRHQRR